MRRTAAAGLLPRSLIRPLLGALLALGLPAGPGCAARRGQGKVSGAAPPERATPTTADFVFGRLELPAGWTLVRESGYDSDAGSLVAPDSRLVIQYDHGRTAGLYADPEHSSKYEWFRTEVVRGKTLFCAFKDQRIAITFLVGGTPYNFYARVEQRAQVNQVLTIMRTFEPFACPWNQCATSDGGS